MSFSINFKNILVVGVGLIGGSIIRALKESSFSGKVYGIDKNASISNCLNKLLSLAIKISFIKFHTIIYIYFLRFLL